MRSVSATTLTSPPPPKPSAPDKIVPPAIIFRSRACTITVPPFPELTSIAAAAEMPVGWKLRTPPPSMRSESEFTRTVPPLPAPSVFAEIRPPGMIFISRACTTMVPPFPEPPKKSTSVKIPVWTGPKSSTAPAASRRSESAITLTFPPLPVPRVFEKIPAPRKR